MNKSMTINTKGEGFIFPKKIKCYSNSVKLMKVGQKTHLNPQFQGHNRISDLNEAMLNIKKQNNSSQV